MMNLPRSLLSVSILVALSGLSACGGGGGGTTDPTPTSTSGVMVDDLIVDATVFCDTDGNGTLTLGTDGEPAEPTATTDASGVYRFSPACNAPILSVAGTGYDKTSRKSVKGVYRAKAGGSVLSPFTTLQQTSGLTDSQLQTVLAKLGLAGVDLSTFNPVATDSGKAVTAAAVIKIINDITETIAAAGGDPQAAFGAAIKELAAQLKDRTLASGSTIFDSDLDLGDVIEKAAKAGFAAGKTTDVDWDDSAIGNAAALAKAGITPLVRNIKGKTKLDDIRNDFNNDSVANIIRDVDLKDSTKVKEAEDSCKNGEHHDYGDDNRKPFVWASGDSFSIYNGSVGTTYTLDQFTAGLALTGRTLGSLSRLELPLTANARALPSKGREVELGLEVTQIGGSRKLQLLLDHVVLKRDATSGLVSASLSSKSELYFYAKTQSGIEIGTGKSPLANVGTLLSNSSTGIGLDMAALQSLLSNRFTSSSAQIGQMFATNTGSYQVRMVVSDLDLRKVDGSQLGTGSIQVVAPLDSKNRQKKVERVSGVLVEGKLNF